MKFTMARDVLADALTWTARTLPNRPPTPILAGVRISADASGIVTLETFDYETSTRSEVAGDVAEPGAVLVSGRLLSEISRALPDKPVDLALDGNKVVLTCGTGRFTLLTMPIEDYPDLPSMPDYSGTVAGDVLTAAVAQVAVAASKDETLPLLTGVRVEVDGDKMTLLATDRYRLAMRELTWAPTRPDLRVAALIRARTLTDVARSLGTAGGRVDVALSEGADLVGFEAGGRRVTSQLFDGDYPPVRRLFPDSTPTHAVVATAPLVEAAKRVSVVAPRNTSVRLSFSAGQVVLNAGQGEDAQASEALEASLVGDDIAVALNPQFLLDGLSAPGKDFVRLSFTDPRKPVVFTGQDSLHGDDDTSYRYLVVPIRFP